MHRTSPTKERRFRVAPTTPVGRRALGFFGASLVAWVITPLGMVVPTYVAWVIWAVGVLGTIALLMSGALALTAIVRDKERALSVFAVVIMVLWFLIAVVAILLSGGEG